MKTNYKSLLLLLMVFTISTGLLAQKKTKKKLITIDFEYQGKKFLIQKGTKLHLGMGTADDGSFNYIEGKKHVSGSTWIDVNMSKFNSNKNGTITTIQYWKPTDEYTIYFKIDKGGYFNIQLYEAALKGELLGIDDFYFDQNNSNPNRKNTPNTASNSNNLSHILKLINGSEIKCNILEFIPSESIKIETFDGSIFVFKAKEIKALVVNESASKNSVEQKSNINQYSNGAVSGNFEEVEKKKFSILGKDSTIKRFYNGVEASVSYQLPDLYDYTLKSSWLGFGVKYTAGYQLNHYLMLGANIGTNVHLGPNFQSKIENTDGFVIGYFGFAQKVSLLGKRKFSPEIGLNENLGSLISHDGRFLFDFEASIGVRIKSKSALSYRLSTSYNFQNMKYSTYSLNQYYSGPFKAQHLKLNFGLNF